MVHQRNVVCVCVCVCVSRSVMSDSVWPIDSRPSGSPVPGILQARTLEWVAISFSNAGKWRVKVKVASVVSYPMDCSLRDSSIHGIFQARILEWVAISFSRNSSWAISNTKRWKCCTQYASKFGKLSNGHRTGKGQFSFQSQRKAMPKNPQTTTQLHSSHMVVK